MKFAVIRTGGKQYLVHPGQTLKIEKLSKDGVALPVGEKVYFEDVLASIDGDQVLLGKPTTGQKVEAEVISQGRHKKVTVVRYMPKSRWAKKSGHKQPFTEVKILAV